MNLRTAILSDCSAIARIYNQGIVDRIATFETRLRTSSEIESWFDGKHPIVVVEEAGKIAGFAATFPYRQRDCYAGVAEFSVYVDRHFRGKGAGRLAMQYLIEKAAEAGFWKLVSRIFPENTASLQLMRSLGFREVGIYQNHARLDGAWRDVVIVEYLIRQNL